MESTAAVSESMVPAVFPLASSSIRIYTFLSTGVILERFSAYDIIIYHRDTRWIRRRNLAYIMCLWMVGILHTKDYCCWLLIIRQDQL